MSREEAHEQLAFAAGEVRYANIIGDYPPYSFAVSERKLLKVLTERFKAEHKARKQDLRNSSGSGVEIGHSINDVHNGMEC